MCAEDTPRQGAVGMMKGKNVDRMAKAEVLKLALKSLADRESKKKWKKYQKEKAKSEELRKEFEGSTSVLHELYQACLKRIQPVTEPIALISQIQRSGGTLLSQLFDGHPELHAHPHELRIGKPKWIWPKIDLNDSPEIWFETLFETSVVEHFRNGYKKDRSMKDDTALPFIFLPSLQARIFRSYTDSLATVGARDVFDAYMTSYFGAWLNNQNSAGQKKFVTGFTPRLAMIQESIESFFQIYPDGRLISIVRDPRNWYPSALRHYERHYDDIREALSLWNESALTAVSHKKSYGERVCIIKFEDLVGKTEAVMRHLAQFLGIRFDPILLIPTFNKNLIGANTSFEVREPGVMMSTLSRHRILSEDQLGIIESMTAEDYRNVLSYVERF
jgi:hypothetical protein